MRVARGRYVVLLNNDTVQIANASARRSAIWTRTPTSVALGIRHLNADEARSVQPSCFAFPEPGRHPRRARGEARGGERNPVLTERDVDWVCGASSS